MAKEQKTAAKTSYPMTMLPSSKTKFLKIKSRDKKTCWEIFDDMLQAYEEKFGKQKASELEKTA
jgi:hypothetical protein